MKGFIYWQRGKFVLQLHRNQKVQMSQKQAADKNLKNNQLQPPWGNDLFYTLQSVHIKQMKCSAEFLKGVLLFFSIFFLTRLLQIACFQYILKRAPVCACLRRWRACFVPATQQWHQSHTIQFLKRNLLQPFMQLLFVYALGTTHHYPVTKE